MDRSNPEATVLLVKKGRVSRIGTDDILSLPEASGLPVIDMQQQVILPGFVDAHSHFPSSGLSVLGANLRPSPLGSVDSIQVLLSTLTSAEKSLTDNRWLLGFNYDNTVFESGLHPTRTQLDGISTERPIYVWHQSGHMGVANSAALKALGYQESSVAPFGGHLGRDFSTGRLNGLLQESAAPDVSRILKSVPTKELLAVLSHARNEYLAAGVTTVQDGYSGESQMRLWRWAQRLGLLPQRIVVWPAHKKMGKKILARKFEFSSNESFYFGPVKIIADGSPQGLTAYLTEPYFRPQASGLQKNYAGFPAMPSSVLNQLVEQYHQEGFNLAVHSNGDAAIDDVLDAIESAQKLHPRPDARHIIVHAQTVRQDQIRRMEALNVSASFFVTHTYYWGVWHETRSLGPERAANISPTGWADEESVRYSLHTDAPVTPMDPMQLIWSAVERKTLRGNVLGANQRVSVDRALHALTIDAAWQSGTESAVGSLEVGKHADFIVLSDDPYEVSDVRQISVQSTFIGGDRHHSSDE